MVVVEEFATKFKIQFAIKLRNALFDVLRLNALIFFVVKSYFHNACKVTAFFLERKIERGFFEGRVKRETRESDAAELRRTQPQGDRRGRTEGEPWDGRMGTETHEGTHGGTQAPNILEG